MTEQVLVVGAGMTGHRFVDELVRRDADGRFAVHVVGGEEYEPYNRVLLSEVVAGRAAWAALGLPRLPSRVRLQRGRAAVRLDRASRTVRLDDGSSLAYDRLVLATGARAFVPPLRGLETSPRHVHTLRDLDDTRAVVARAANARHAVVLGGGVLGLEAACGLAARGLAVTLVQRDDRLMPGDLGEAASAALVAALQRLGIDVRTRTGVDEAISAYGELVAVRLDDGSLLSTDLLLVSCGVRPESGLAQDAGLPVENGVVVDGTLASPADDRVHAVGDCAQEPGVASGLVAPGWEQAERLAALLTGTAPPSARGGGADIRLKAVGIDLVVLGRRPGADGDRVVTVDDPGTGRHAALVLHGERLVGATCLGMPSVAAELSVALDRGTPLPADPLALLLPERRTEEATPVRMPAGTTVCRCNDVSKQDVVDAWEGGARTVDAVADATRATTGCGGCEGLVCGLVDWLRAADPEAEPPPVPEAATQPGPTAQFARP